MGANYELEKLKPLIRSMVMSHRSKTVSIQELQRDFEDIEGCPIPYAQLGFASVFALLHGIPDIVKVSTQNGIPVVTHVSSPATEHVERLIQLSGPRQRRGRNMYPKYSTNEYRSYTPRTLYFDQNYPILAETTTPKRSYAEASNGYALKNQRIELAYPSLMETISDAKKCLTPIKEDSDRNHRDQICTPSQQPTAQDSDACSDETCEHVDGSVMSWKPYCDMWDMVNMIDLPPDVMNLSHTIPKANVSHYFAEKAETNVRILHVLNPNRIWVVSVLQDNTLEQLHVQMQECYNNATMTDKWYVEANKVQHGLYCAAKIDDDWYRARIVAPLIRNQVKLFFIDIGLIDIVDYRGIKFLFKVFRAIPAQAIRASLAGLIPKNNAWTRAESENFTTSFTLGKSVLTAYTLNINYKVRVLDVVLKTAKNININEQFALVTNARWTGAIYLSEESSAYRNKRQSFNEKYPSFFCIEEGHFPSVGELRHFTSRNFDYEELYTRLPHFQKNGVVEKISREANEKMVQLHGIVSASDEEELQITSKEREE